MTKTLVYYHNADLDGLCSGAVAYRYYGSTAEYRGVNYGDPTELDPTFDEILFLDFPLRPIPDPIPDNVRVYDHHKTSIGLPGIVDVNRAACQIVWDFFVGSVPRPHAVDFIGAADRWQAQREDWFSRVVPFCLALETLWPDITHPLWQKLFTDNALWPSMAQAGEHMLMFSQAQNKRLYQEQAYKTTFHGHPAVVLIGGTKGSERFVGPVDPAEIHIVAQRRANSQWVYSLRSHADGPDVSDIAKQYGGGGHAHAAGFEHMELLV